MTSMEALERAVRKDQEIIFARKFAHEFARKEAQLQQQLQQQMQQQVQQQVRATEKATEQRGLKLHAQMLVQKGLASSEAEALQILEA